MFEIGDNISVFNSDSILDGETGKIVGHTMIFDKKVNKVKLDNPRHPPIYLLKDHELKHIERVFSEVDPYGEENWD